MSKQLFQLQQNIKFLREQIKDLLHVSYLNKQSLICLQMNKQNKFQQIKSTEENISDNNEKKKNKILDRNIFQKLIEVFEKRCENHLNYLIIKQIQQEQDSVRRDRLIQYEDRIYDNRRLISDKEAFLQNIIRPKKKRPENMTVEDFQEIRQKQKAKEEKKKLSNFQTQLKNIKILYNRFIPPYNKNIHEEISKLKSFELQYTKANSIQSVNIMNNLTIDKQKRLLQTQIQNVRLKPKDTQINLKNKQITHNNSGQQIKETIIKIKKQLLDSNLTLPEKVKEIQQTVKRIALIKISNLQKLNLCQEQNNENKHLKQLLKSMQTNYKSKQTNYKSKQKQK